jgi:hypothetical protein
MAKNRKARDGKMAAAGDDAEINDPDFEVKDSNVLVETAEDDRLDAKARHMKKGLDAAKETAANILKLAAAGLADETEELRAMLLNKIADLGGDIRDAARKAVREAKTETRNVQR